MITAVEDDEHCIEEMSKIAALKEETWLKRGILNTFLNFHLKA